MTGHSPRQSETLRNVAVSARQRAHDGTKAQRHGDAENERRRTRDAEFSQSKEQLLLNTRIKEWCELHGKQPPLPKLTEAVHNVIEKWFALVDDDQSGTLEIQELEAALKASNLPCGRGNILELLDLMDFNRDFTISRDEFLLFFLTEWGRGKNLLSGDYILPSGLALPLGAMVSKMKRERLMRDVMKGGDLRKRWMEVSEDPRALQRELNTTDLGDPAVLEAASNGHQLLHVAFTSFMKSFHHRDEQMLNQRQRDAAAAVRAAREEASKAARLDAAEARRTDEPKQAEANAEVSAVNAAPESPSQGRDDAGNDEVAAAAGEAQGAAADVPESGAAASHAVAGDAAGPASPSDRDLPLPLPVEFSETLAQARVANGDIAAPPPHMGGPAVRGGPSKNKGALSSWEVQAAVAVQQRLAKVIAQVPAVTRRHVAAGGSRSRREHDAPQAGAMAQRPPHSLSEPSQQAQSEAWAASSAVARRGHSTFQHATTAAESTSPAAPTWSTMPPPAPPAPSLSRLPALPALSAVRSAEWSQFVGASSAPSSPTRAADPAGLPELSLRHSRHRLPPSSSVSTSWDAASYGHLVALRSVRSLSDVNPKPLGRPSLLGQSSAQAVGADELGHVGLTPGAGRSQLMRVSVVGHEAPGGSAAWAGSRLAGFPPSVRLAPSLAAPQAAAPLPAMPQRPVGPVELPRFSVALPPTMSNPKAAAAVIDLAPFEAGKLQHVGGLGRRAQQHGMRVV